MKFILTLALLALLLCELSMAYNHNVLRQRHAKHQRKHKSSRWFFDEKFQWKTGHVVVTQGTKTFEFDGSLNADDHGVFFTNYKGEDTLNFWAQTTYDEPVEEQGNAHVIDFGLIVDCKFVRKDKWFEGYNFVFDVRTFKNGQTPSTNFGVSVGFKLGSGVLGSNDVPTLLANLKTQCVKRQTQIVAERRAQEILEAQQKAKDEAEAKAAKEALEARLAAEKEAAQSKKKELEANVTAVTNTAESTADNKTAPATVENVTVNASTNTSTEAPAEANANTTVKADVNAIVNASLNVSGNASNESAQVIAVPALNTSGASNDTTAPAVVVVVNQTNTTASGAENTNTSVEVSTVTAVNVTKPDGTNETIPVPVTPTTPPPKVEETAVSDEKLELGNKFVKKILVHHDCGYGNALYLTGEDKSWGSWKEATKLKVVKKDLWVFTLFDMPEGAPFKIIKAPWTDKATININEVAKGGKLFWQNKQGKEGNIKVKWEGRTMDVTPTFDATPYTPTRRMSKNHHHDAKKNCKHHNCKKH